MFCINTTVSTGLGKLDQGLLKSLHRPELNDEGTAPVDNSSCLSSALYRS